MDLGLYGDWRLAAERLASMNEPSPFVIRQLERSGMTAAEAATSPATWHQLKPLVKDDFLEDQRLAPPFGTRIAIPPRKVEMIVESSGSTTKGRETHYLSGADVDRLSKLWAGHLSRMGVGAEDVVTLTFPIGMAGGGVKHAGAYQALGAKVLRVSNLSTVAKLDAMRYYGATIIVATPSYVDRLAVVAAELGHDPASFGIRRIVVATQSVTVDWISTTEARWGAHLYEWYGTSAGLVAFCCEKGMLDAATGRRGTLHWDPDSALQEIVDPATLELVAGGERGELIGTALINEAEPFFRYATGDGVRFIAPGTCVCGSDRPGIESGTVRRLDEMFKIKGVNLWPSSVEATIFSFVAVQDYRGRFRQDSAGREIAEIEVFAPAAGDGLAAELTARLREDAGIGFQVSVARAHAEWSQETVGEAAKAKRWLDLRAK